MDTPDQPRQVIHLHLLTEDNHYYFGSISAMFEHFNRDQLGVAIQTLYNQWRNESVYRNEKIILRKGRLIQKKHS